MRNTSIATSARTTRTSRTCSARTMTWSRPS
jgi:hypothetical protein